jgi:hypothetical protein
MAPDFLMRKGSRLFRFKAALGLFQALPDLGLPEKGIQFIADGIGPVSRHGSSLLRLICISRCPFDLGLTRQGALSPSVRRWPIAATTGLPDRPSGSPQA